MEKCIHCNGSGKVTCVRCAGTRTFVDKSLCYYCQGSGRMECPVCKGAGKK